MLTESSPLRKPPAELSRRQVLVLDGIRYAAEMAHIAYERLATHLQTIAASDGEPRVRDIGTAMLDAWSIVDSAHRFRDMLANLPGLPNQPWKRLLSDRTEDVATLRNKVQHQLGEISDLVTGGGQLWGYLSWAEYRDGKHTGKWLMMTAGSDYVGDTWYFAGPNALPFSVPPGRVRLNAFGQQVYLGRTVEALREAVVKLEGDIESGVVRPVGPPATDRRGADIVYEAFIEVLHLNGPSST